MEGKRVRNRGEPQLKTGGKLRPILMPEATAYGLVGRIIFANYSGLLFSA